MNYSYRIVNNKLTEVEYSKGDFKCQQLELTSLENVPENISGNFVCYENKIKSLKEGPKQVKGDYLCQNNKLQNLEGCPKQINGKLYCFSNKITTLENGPEVVENLNCSVNNLTNFKGCPKVLSGVIIAGGNKNLNDISDIPSDIHFINVANCSKIEKFTEVVDDSLMFYLPTDEVRQRIKQWSLYNIVNETFDSITVMNYNDNELFMNSL